MNRTRASPNGPLRTSRPRGRRLLPTSLLALALIATACAPSGPPGAPAGGAPSVTTAPPAATTSAGPATSAAPTRAPSGAPGPAPARTPLATPDLSRVGFSLAGWKTDFSKHSVPLEEITSGGPPRDGIPPLDHPTFESVSQVDAWLAPREPVVFVQVRDQARAYPLQILVWHEIVNDVLGDVPVAITYCPLCNSAIAFDRRLGERVLDFGTSGNLRNSDLVMWDRQTESWWQQLTGEAIVGELTGARLQPLPALVVPWSEFRARFPQGQVLSRNTGYRRDYGRNPYLGYDELTRSPFLFAGTPDGRLPPMERVVALHLGDEDVAYPFSALSARHVVADRVGGEPIVVLYQPGTLSPLDTGAIAQGRDVGAAAVYRPRVQGRSLTFAWQQEAFVDAETGSRWDLFGQAVAGPLAGQRLEPVVHGTYFWFAWAAFKPQTRVWTP